MGPERLTMTPALSLALDALQDANQRYIHACRAHVADLLSMLPQDDVTMYLLELDEIERDQDRLVAHIKRLAEDD